MHFTFYLGDSSRIGLNLQFHSYVKSGLPDFTSKSVHELAFGTPKFYIAPYDKINHGLVNLSCNYDVKSGLRLFFLFILKNGILCVPIRIASMRRF